MIEPIIDEATHRRALQRIEAIWDAEPGSGEAAELDALATLVDAYERRRFPIMPLDPIAAIQARSEELGWSRKDLEPLIGSRARVSEVLLRKRSLTLPMIRRLHAAMGIPAEVLIAQAGPGLRSAKARSPRKSKAAGAR